MQATDTLQVIEHRGMWCVRYLGPQRDQMLDLFGTDTLPTPFSTLSPKADVLSVVRKLNPTAKVE